jgi:hypothetical protein
MNIQSIILLTIIAAAVMYGIYKIVHSKGACEDCDVSCCPAHVNEALKK